MSTPSLSELRAELTVWAPCDTAECGCRDCQNAPISPKDLLVLLEIADNAWAMEAHAQAVQRHSHSRDEARAISSGLIVKIRSALAKVRA